MLKKLEVLEDKYKELTEKISDPEIINDQKAWQKYMKEHADLEPIVMKYREYTNVLQSIADSKEILTDPAAPWRDECAYPVRGKYEKPPHLRAG